MKLVCGLNTKEIEGNEKVDFLRRHTLPPSGYMRVTNLNVLLPKAFENVDLHLNAFKVRNDDTFVCGYPKTGTSWVEEIAWTILNNRLHQKDVTEPIYLRSFFYEADAIVDTSTGEYRQQIQRLFGKTANKSYLDFIARQPNFRIIKSHLPYAVMHCDVLEKARVIYIIRHPLDVYYSYYRWYKSNIPLRYKGDIHDFHKDFKFGRVLYGSIVNHYNDWWKYKNHKNILIVKYEDLHTDPETEIRRMAEFLQVYLNDKRVSEIAQRTSYKIMKETMIKYSDMEAIKNMYNEESIKNQEWLMRKGEVGEGMKAMGIDMIDNLNCYFELCLKDLKLPYVYDVPADYDGY